MSTKIYIDNLATATTESELTALFSAHGNVVSVRIVVDRTSRKPCGFGFVTMVTSEGARAAIQALNGKALGANTLLVSEAWPNQDRTSSRREPRSPRRVASQLY